MGQVTTGKGIVMLRDTFLLRVYKSKKYRQLCTVASRLLLSTCLAMLPVYKQLTSHRQVKPKT